MQNVTFLVVRSLRGRLSRPWRRSDCTCRASATISIRAGGGVSSIHLVADSSYAFLMGRMPTGARAGGFFRDVTLLQLQMVCLCVCAGADACVSEIGAERQRASPVLLTGDVREKLLLPVYIGQPRAYCVCAISTGTMPLAMTTASTRGETATYFWFNMICINIRR